MRTVFTIFEGPSGWYVQGPERVGPVQSKERAIDLAQGMAWAVSLLGKETEVRLEPRSWVDLPDG